MNDDAFENKPEKLPFAFTVPKSGIYQVTTTATAGDILCLNKYATKSVEIIKPKWWQFWKPVIEKHYIVYEGKVK